MANTVSNTNASTATSELVATPPVASTKNEAGAADRFLKLLVAQMKNQDPLKPMDNAEVTSQMAQIQTVSGIEKLNTSIASMVGQMSAMQNMQSAALVGRDVMVPGNALTQDAKGNGYGGFELDATAEQVKLEILSTSGIVMDTKHLGAQPAGTHSFSWTLRPGDDPKTVGSFRVTATTGTKEVPSTALMHDQVASVLTGGSTLMLELASGQTVPYSQIKSFN